MQRRLAIATIAAALALGVAFLVGCGKRSSGGEGDVIAKANGKEITRDELLSALESQDLQSGAQVLSELISRQLVRAEAQKRGIKVTDAEIKAHLDAMKNDVAATSDKSPDQAFADYLKNTGQTQQSLEDAISFRILQAKLTLPVEEQKRIFEANKNDFKNAIASANEIALYRRIVVASKPEVEALRKELVAKPGDFAKVATDKSLDPMSRSHGGLALAAKGRTNPPDPALEQALFSLKLHEVSQPLLVVPPQPRPGSQQTQTPPEHWQIVEVERRSTPKPFTFENYQPRIEELIEEGYQQYQNEYAQFVGQLQAKATIEILSPRYKPIQELYKQRQQAYQQMMAAPQAMPGMPSAAGGGGAGGPAGRAPGARAPQGRAPRGR